jgi:hypothetical protein
MSSGTVTSHRTAVVFGTSPARSASRSARRATANTCAPAWLSTSTKCRPRPDDAPVTTAVLPCRSKLLAVAAAVGVAEGAAGGAAVGVAAAISPAAR